MPEHLPTAIRLLGPLLLALLAGCAGQEDPPTSATSATAANGWIAFAVEQEDPAGVGPDTDIWFAALDQEPRRVIGTDTDGVDQLCPAFSPDGRSLAYGSVEGIRAHRPPRAAYRNSALVVADVADDGTVTDRHDHRCRRRAAAALSGLVARRWPGWRSESRAPRPSTPIASGEGSEVWIVAAGRWRHHRHPGPAGDRPRVVARWLPCWQSSVVWRPPWATAGSTGRRMRRSISTSHATGTIPLARRHARRQFPDVVTRRRAHRIRGRLVAG